MIDRPKLLSDLQRLTGRLVSDMRERAEKDPATEAHLKAEYQRAQAAGRTAMAYEAWREDPLTQGAVAWVLSCVFVRFLEDNGFLDAKGGIPQRYLWGAETSLRALADGHWEEHLRLNPSHAEREYLLSVFTEVGQLPGARHLFDPRHNLAFTLAPTADGAKELLKFWRSIEPETGRTVHDFTSVGVGGRSPSLSSPYQGEVPRERRRGPAASHEETSGHQHEGNDPSGAAAPPPLGKGRKGMGVSSSDLTRFLGDLYQDLSEHARSTYALLQTPSFVEEFILDRTLTLAIEEFGYEKVTLIDPACGSGHFLLGAFSRLATLWQENQPGLPGPAVAQKALSAVFGVDLNPFAAAIARFRLLIAALDVAGVSRLADAPDFKINVAVGDSLLHGPKPGTRTEDYQTDLYGDPLGHLYETEDAAELREILFRRYHAVVANPPYITVKDPGLNARYRERFKTCHRQYSLVCPFTERLMDLTLQSHPGGRAGFMGQIVSNAFMKREFGGKLVEEYLPRWDLTHVINTSGAHIPGHGTPTVIMFARARGPLAQSIRTVMGIRGEPKTPEDPAKGFVWSAVVEQVDRPGSMSEWVSVDDVPRERFAKHPWSLGGGGAAELKVTVEASASGSLKALVEAIGRTNVVGEDDAWISTPMAFARRRLVERWLPFVIGEEVRDWGLHDVPVALYPYQCLAGEPLPANDVLVTALWPFRTLLRGRTVFGKGLEENGRPWWEHLEHYRDKLRTPLSITFAFVATHNHFVLDRGGKVFKQSAPVIKLPTGANEDEHIALLGLLNSSTACFWLKQVCYPKGGSGIGRGVQDEDWESRFEFDGTKLQEFPVTSGPPLALARRLDSLAQRFSSLLPASLLSREAPSRARLATAREEALSIRRQMIALQEDLDWEVYGLYGLLPKTPSFVKRGQGELEPPCETATSSPAAPSPGVQTPGYLPAVALPRPGEGAGEESPGSSRQRPKDGSRGFEPPAPYTAVETPHPPSGHPLPAHAGRGEDDADERRGEEGNGHERRGEGNPLAGRGEGSFAIDIGQRAFEIALARRMASGEAESKWFERHGSTPITKIPADWPEPYRVLVQNRLDLIETNPNIALIERPEYKRRWNWDGWDKLEAGALRQWLLDRLEKPDCWPTVELQSTTLLSDRVRRDPDFLEAARLFTNRPDVDVEKLVAELAVEEGVPYLAALRYTENGLRKRALWERTWDLQRAEDRGEKVGDIPVPPKYAREDFLKGSYWPHRGKLDVPKEEFILYPGAERQVDPAPVLGWAGWDHLQRARALSAYYERMKTQEGFTKERMVPLLAGIHELVPWLLQWHNEVDPEFGIGMGTYFEQYVDEEARSLGMLPADLPKWRPEKGAGRRGRREAKR